MEHFYNDVTGWFNEGDAQVYEKAVREAESGARFLEIGCAWGKSTTFMAVEIFNSGKNIDFYTLDIFPKENGDQESNLRWALKDMDNVHIIKDSSINFLSIINPSSFDFIYIDGNHEYDNVKLELYLCWNALRSGGMLAGHDYYNAGHPGVEKAVKEFAIEMNREIEVMGVSFLIRK